ncbi:MAG: hypothetical protein PHI90_03405 [Clostridia bacterium]|nr:hypothetical protein [Clostridia bacterium]MDD4047863.1 hypothetical protein [Clostridia bacterium]
MKKLLLSNQKDMWYFCSDTKEFVFNLLIGINPIKDVSCFDIVIDKEGNPHLLLAINGCLKYYYWNGTYWIEGNTPKIFHLSKCSMVITDKNKIHFLSSSEGSEEHFISHFSLNNDGWKDNKINVLPKQVVVEALLCLREGELVAVYSRQNHTEHILGLLYYSQGKWEVMQEITSLDGKFLNWCTDYQALYILLGKKSFKGGIFTVLAIPYQKLDVKPQQIQENVVGWDGCPGILIDGCKLIRLYWQYKGKIYLTELNREKYCFINQVESDIFYPANMLIPIGQKLLTKEIAFTTIYGVKLDFPLVISLESFDIMVKEKAKVILRPSRS